MKNLREIISKNITTLRKQNKLTQVDLSKKINYSDKAISRWEKGEVLPDVETLDKLSEVFDVPLAYLFEEHTEQVEKKTQTNDLIFYGLLTCVIWIFVTVLFVYIKIIYGHLFWQSFVWGIPISCSLILWANRKWNNPLLNLIFQSVFVWSLITSFYLQFLQQNLWMIYFIGIPIQAAIVVSFFKPK